MPTATAAARRRALTGPALRTFFRIASAWHLSEAEQMRLLGLHSRASLQAWKRGKVATLRKDALERISYVLGIYQGLQVLVPTTANTWVHQPNTAAPFGGLPAIARMTAGNVGDLYVVRQYVDAPCGWG